MKKSLIAMAALGAAGYLFSAVPAMAQSSVTLYGVADAGVGQQKSDSSNRGVRMISSDTMNNGNSRVGVRGVEDLGSGLKVGFNFESGLSLKNGHAGTSNHGGEFWGRQANVWIGADQFGRLTMGRAFTPSFLVADAWELTDFANYSVVAATYGFGGQTGPLSGGLQDVNSIARSNSQFRYDTPVFAGFQAMGSYITHADNEGRRGGAWDLGASYKNGPLSAGASVSGYQKKNSRLSYAVGARYDIMNMFKVAASFDATPYGRRGVSYGGTYYTGPYSLTLDFTTDTNKADPAFRTSGMNKKRTNGMVEGKYALSKQTFVYASYLYFDTKSNWGLGIRHNF